MTDNLSTALTDLVRTVAAFVPKFVAVGGYLSSTDPEQLRSDVAAYRQKAQAKASSAAAKVNQKQQAATAKVTQAGKATATRVRNKPALPIAGVLSIVALVTLRMRKAKAQHPKPVDVTALPAAPAEVPELMGPQFDAPPTIPGEVAGDDRLNLTRAQLRDEATAAGLQLGPT